MSHPYAIILCFLLGVPCQSIGKAIEKKYRCYKINDLADTTGGLRHQPVLTADEFVTADTMEGLRHQPAFLTPEEFVGAAHHVEDASDIFVDAGQECAISGAPCSFTACCAGE